MEIRKLKKVGIGYIISISGKLQESKRGYSQM
jgi:hypothetical protein